MENLLLFEQIKKDFAVHLHFLEDKPEENLDTTVRACWLAAAGLQVSAEDSSNYELPELDDCQLQMLYQIIQKRMALVPLAHITGRQRFMNLEFLSDKRAMIPRKETELLCNEALRISIEMAQHQDAVQIVDVCCGSGNIGLAIAHHNPLAKVFSTDISHEAISLTLDNTTFLNLNHKASAAQGDLLEALKVKSLEGKVDMIICNPPYISSGKVSKMHSEVQSHEPSQAFDGGRFGIDIIQRVLMEAPAFLKNNGWLLLEVGAGQAEFVMEIYKRTEQYKDVQSVADANGMHRVIIAQKMDSYTTQGLN